MPTDQPNNAPDDLTPRDDATPGSVLSGELSDANTPTPGGGGMGGAGGTTPPRAQGGTTPNSPIDVATPAGGGDASDEARARAVDETAEAKPVSR